MKLIPYAQTLPAYMSPAIHFAQPRWTARIANSRISCVVHASGPCEARLKGAAKLHTRACSVVVCEEWDPKLTRFGRLA